MIQLKTRVVNKLNLCCPDQVFPEHLEPRGKYTSCGEIKQSTANISHPIPQHNSPQTNKTWNVAVKDVWVVNAYKKMWVFLWQGRKCDGEYMTGWDAKQVRHRRVRISYCTMCATHCETILWSRTIRVLPLILSQVNMAPLSQRNSLLTVLFFCCCIA